MNLTSPAIQPVQGEPNMSRDIAFGSSLEALLSEENDLAKRASEDSLLSSNQARDERKSSRLKVPSKRQHCELKVGVNVLPALVENSSKCGFAVLINGLHGLIVGQNVLLHTDAGWFTIRIVHILEVVRPKTADVGNSDCGPWFRLGCSRVGQGPLSSEPSASPPSGSLWKRLTRKLFPFLG